MNDSAKKGKQFNAGEGSTNCSSFAIKRRTCIPLEYNRGSCLEKKVASTWLPVSRVFSCQLVAVQWKKPISPVANGWLEVVGRGTGGSGWRGKNKKKEKNIKKKRKREERREGKGRERGEKKGRENNVRFPRLSDRAWQREQTYPNLTL